MSLIWPITDPIWPIAATAPLVSDWMLSIFRLMSSVALAVSLASSFTSFATGETLSCFAGPRRLDGGVQRQQVCLLRNRGDHLDHLSDFGAALAEFGDGQVGG